MAYKVQILLDTLAGDAPRLTTIRGRVPRIILPQIQTHGAVLYNTESSRAKPLGRFSADVIADPFAPEVWKLAGKGMTPSGPADAATASAAWTYQDALLKSALNAHEEMTKLNIAKEQANRYLEPWAWINVVMTGTADGWANFFALRTHEAADDQFQIFARALYVAYARSNPVKIKKGQWHLPFVSAEERGRTYTSADAVPLSMNHGINKRTAHGWAQSGKDDMRLRMADLTTDRNDVNRAIISVARCARVSYGRTHGKTGAFAEDVATFDKLTAERPVHASPLHHQCYPLEWLDPQQRAYMHTPLSGWTFLRRLIEGETTRTFAAPEETVKIWSQAVPAGVYEWQEES